MPDEKKIVHQQLALLEDAQGQSLQSRFEEFCSDAVASLTRTDAHGEPIFPARKAAAEMHIKVSLSRTADDALVFEFDHSAKTKMPQVPGKVRTSHVVRDVGLAQRVSTSEAPLFNPRDGQPEPLAKDEAARVLGN